MSGKQKKIAKAFKMCYYIDRTSKYNMRAKKAEKAEFLFPGSG